MFDLDHWLATQDHYGEALLLSKRSAKLSLKDNSAFHKVKWGQTEKEIHFLKKEASWLSRIERKAPFIRQTVYVQDRAHDPYQMTTLAQTPVPIPTSLLFIEYIDGLSVSDVLKSPIDKTVFDDASTRNQFILSLLSAIDSLHGQGIVHGDIKASNVLLTPDHTVRLIDFATADWIGASNDNKPFLMKTLSYSLPEPYSSTSAVPAIDWYAFFMIVDLVYASAPVTLKQYDLKYYLQHHQNRILKGEFGRDLKPMLEKVFTELTAYLMRVSSEH